MRSPVWKYYTVDNEQRTCTCNRCTQTYTANHSGGGGKNKLSYPLNRMARHLVEEHPTEFYTTASERDFITSANVFLNSEEEGQSTNNNTNQSSFKSNGEYVRCPLCGELVAGTQLSHHLRFIGFCLLYLNSSMFQRKAQSFEMRSFRYILREHRLGARVRKCH